MKTALNLLSIGILIMTMPGCSEKITDRYKVNSPVYMTKSEFRNSVKVLKSESISNPGKIYFKDHYIFINEPLKGIHVIDNTNPSAPVNVTFISIPGNVDMAIKDSILYADSFVDLVAMNISDINNIYETGRIDSIFPYSLPPLPKENNFPINSVDASKGIVVGWVTKEISQDISMQQNNYPIMNEGGILNESFSSSKVSYSASEGSSGMSVGIAGSMARFTISDNFLYTVDRYNLKIFNISTLDKPVNVYDQSIGWNIETVFPYHSKLFFGTQTGMIIYDISNPASPVYITTYSHVRSCDPVVVDGKYAYITLRAGNLCGSLTSQLDVVDISDLQNLSWKQSYPMDEPYGLGIDGKTLFVCDGPAGLKVYKADDPLNLQKIAWFSDINAYDVIPYQGVLMTIGSGGLFQYSYNGSDKVSLLSQIPIVSSGK